MLSVARKLTRNGLSSQLRPYSVSNFGSLLKPTEASLELNIPSNIVFEDIDVLSKEEQRSDEVINKEWYEERKKADHELVYPVLDLRKASNVSENEILLNPLIFNLPVRVDIIHSNVHWMRMNWFQSTKKVKTRAERSGTGRKPFPQKGRGKARQGSLRSPQFRKGGIAHGPRPRDMSFKLNKKVQLLGIKSSLSAKVVEDNILFVKDIPENLEYQQLGDFFAQQEIEIERTKFLFLDSIRHDNVEKVMKEAKRRSISRDTTELHVYDLMDMDKVIVTERALADLDERLIFTKNSPVANQVPRPAEVRSFTHLIKERP